MFLAMVVAILASVQPDDPDLGPFLLKPWEAEKFPLDAFLLSLPVGTAFSRVGSWQDPDLDVPSRDTTWYRMEADGLRNLYRSSGPGWRYQIGGVWKGHNFWEAEIDEILMADGELLSRRVRSRISPPGVQPVLYRESIQESPSAERQIVEWRELRDSSGRWLSLRRTDRTSAEDVYWTTDSIEWGADEAPRRWITMDSSRPSGVVRHDVVMQWEGVRIAAATNFRFVAGVAEDRGTVRCRWEGDRFHECVQADGLISYQVQRDPRGLPVCLIEGERDTTFRWTHDGAGILTGTVEIFKGDGGFPFERVTTRYDSDGKFPVFERWEGCATRAEDSCEWIGDAEMTFGDLPMARPLRSSATGTGRSRLLVRATTEGIAFLDLPEGSARIRLLDVSGRVHVQQDLSGGAPGKSVPCPSGRWVWQIQDAGRKPLATGVVIRP